MRNKIIAGNWKMNKDVFEAADLINGLKKALASPKAEVIVCPPYTSLVIAQQLLKGSPIKLGAQDVSVRDDGAFTGEVSSKMLKAVGCDFVIVGHSERRQYFHESNDLINQKAKKVLTAGMKAIVCVGETLEEREKGIMDKVITAQVKGVLAGLTQSDLEKVIVAYEPVWAIGTGKTASPQQAQEVHLLIRKLVGQLYNWNFAEKLIILYGGSVKSDNAKELLSQPDIDGALVGGACLKVESFLPIIEAC